MRRGPVLETGNLRTVQIREDKLHILQFLVEITDDFGEPREWVPVEMKGKAFDGYVDEGHLVAVFGEWRRGKVIRSKRVYNLTTDARVIARMSTQPCAVRAIMACVLIAILSAFCWGFGFIAYTISDAENARAENVDTSGPGELIHRWNGFLSDHIPILETDNPLNVVRMAFLSD